MPSILFVHTNFPAQFGAMGARLRAGGWRVAFATERAGARSDIFEVLPFRRHREPSKQTHRYLIGMERAVITGQGAARAFYDARARGFRPDVIIAHAGWGAGLFARDVWPGAAYVPYVEWWYRYPPIDSVFLDAHAPSEDVRLMQRLRNAPTLMDLDAGAFAICPTQFQAAQFPARWRPAIEVIHDGVDVALHAPAAQRPSAVGGVDLTGAREIVTYATRGMEPQRGFPQFMRALAALQTRRPGLHALIVGEDRVAYGAQLPQGESWRRRMEAELDLDPARTHFLGRLPRPDYVRALQASDAHVYLTAPFVLSWSLLEAMAIGCPLVASDTAPVREVARHGETALLAGFHDTGAIADAVERLLEDRALARRLGAAAREAIIADYAFDALWPRKRALLERARDHARDQADSGSGG